jgi:DNA polymerase III subunit alpha
MTDEYILRKHGKKWKKLHPIYEKITKDTYGIIVYQEQISKIIHEIAGLSKVIADKIRKIIAKKRDAALLEEYHNMFIDGCIKEKTLSKDEAVTFWNALMENASYLFNLSHSTAYAIIGYWTLYLKANYPVEFICSSLSFAEWDEKSNDPFKRKSTLIEELSDLGLKIYPPKIGYSDPIKWVHKNNNIYIPFVEISGIGETQAEKCCEIKKKSSGRLKGFFGKEYEETNKNKTKVDMIMDELKCHLHDSFPDDEIIKQYLGYEI